MMDSARKPSVAAGNHLDGVCADADHTSLRIAGNRGKQVHFTWNGESIEAFEGETIAAALLSHGVRSLRVTERKGKPRGLFCNMGICFDCLVEVNGNTNQRACQYLVTEGLEVKSQNTVNPLERHE